jgi:hypothetical protein
MFDMMSTISSAGSTLLIPDCEFTHLRSYEAFYAKQVAFTFIVPVIIFVCVLVWSCIGATCAERCKIQRENLKNYAILSIVLCVFLCYPMIVSFCLAMLKCPRVGQQLYLMADLQEECFGERHTVYVITLTIPQLLLYVFGLPLAAGMLLTRKSSREKMKTSKTFKLRYGLLFLGYRPERGWWEVVVAARKVAVVAVGTFGTITHSVDLQVAIALFIVFISIVTHLSCHPFDVNTRNGRILHNLEFAALSLCFITFWGGLLFYLGPSVVGHGTHVFLTILIVGLDLVFLVFSIFLFAREFVRETREKRKTRRLSLMASSTVVKPLEMLMLASQHVKEKADVPIEHPRPRSTQIQDADKLHDNFWSS